MSRFLRIKKERAAKGLCPNCGKEAEIGCYRCNDCGLKHRITERERYDHQSYKVSGINNHVVKHKGE